MATRLTLFAFLFTTLLSGALAAQPAPTLAKPTASASAPPKLGATKPDDVRAVEKDADDATKARALDCAVFMASLRKYSTEDERNLAPEQKALLLETVERCATADTAAVTSGGVATDLVRTVAQVVVDKVQRQGWEALRNQLKKLARCAEEDAEQTGSYPHLCKVLDTATIQDLVAAPEVLLDAVAQDLLAMASASAKLNTEAGQALGEFLSTGTQAASLDAFSRIGAAHRLGADVLLRRLQQILLEKARRLAMSALECDPAWSSPHQALWVAGRCFIEHQSNDALNRCDFSGWVAKCQAPAAEKTAQESKADRVLLFLTSAQDVLGSKPSSERAEATVRLVFSMARAQVEETLEPTAKAKALLWLDAFEDMLVGLVNRDWVRVVSGATRVASYVVESSQACALAASDPGACTKSKADQAKLLSLLGAIGNYALTYKNDDAEKAQVDREKIMGELVDRMVSRTSKEEGLKFSLGGSLGLLGGVRTARDFSAAQVAFPVQLGLGFGLQSYCRGDGGFHLMVTVLDVGQYVTVDNSKLEVEEPDIEAAVTLGLTLGGWVWNRELPLYVSGYFGYSPFVREEEGDGAKPTLQAGVATGFYVPLLDFN